MADLNVGVVGLGWAAGAHIAAFKQVKGARVAAVCSRQKLSAVELERQYGLPLKVYRDYDAMLADPQLDIIDICTPHACHPAQTIAAARANKHVLIEKPVAVTYEDAKAVRRTIRKAGVKACVCFECRFSKHFTLTRSLLDQGLLGELHYAEVDYYHGIGPWYGQYAWNAKKEIGGSSLITAGCHALDVLLFLMGDKVTEVTCYSAKSKSELFAAYEYDPTSVTILKFRNGAIAKVASSVDCLQPYYFHSHLLGSKGSLLDNRFYSLALPGMTKERWSTLETELVDSGDVKDHPYEPQFQAFVDAIVHDTVMPLTDFETAFESHRVCFAADRSVQTGRPVRMKDMV